MSYVLAPLRRLWAAARPAALWSRQRLGRPGHAPPAWESDLLDDFAFNRPWNVAVKILRIQAFLRRNRLRPGTTIVIVNWNTRRVLQDTVRAVRALTSASADLMVVDNGSNDGSKEWLRQQDDIRTLALPANAGHAIALDIAMLLVRTDVAVTLDSDAVPLSSDWLASVIDPLQQPGVVLAGLRSTRDFVHPVFSALRVRAFIDRKLSFQVWRLPNIAEADHVWGETCFDTGELMSRRLNTNEIRLVDVTPNPVEGLPGMTTGAVVYHHGGITRASEATGHDSDDATYAEWQYALTVLLPVEARPIRGDVSAG